MADDLQNQQEPLGQHQQIDRYVIRRVLGTGAMGAVYAAWDPKLHREVALKVVPSRLSQDAKGRARFEREARAIAAVRHPNIVEIYDYSGTDSQYLYLVIEKLDGEDLYATLHRRGQMPEPMAAAVGHELCLALQVAHEAGIIHRDLKPENVFVNQAGRVVLTDFGIVKAIAKGSAVDGFKEPTDVIGTPGFMAPELLNGRALGPAIDIFALGVLLYNITTRRLPFEGATPLDIFQAAADGRYDDPRTHNPHLSDDFCAVIAQCLHPNPKKRPRSAEVVRQALKTVLEDNGISDVRDDLREFMTNSEAYRQMAHARCVDHVLAQLKIAAKDHDTGQVESFRQRLMVLDPYNEDIWEVSGVGRPLGQRLASGRLQAVRNRLGAQMARMMGSGVQTLQRVHKGVRTGVPRWLQATSLSLVCVGMGAGVMFHHHQRTDDAPIPHVAIAAAPIPAPTLAVPPVPVTEAVTTTPTASAPHPTTVAQAGVDMRIAGGRATLLIDGKFMGRFSHKHLQLAAGQHVFEVLRRGRGCKRIITVTGGEKLAVKADIKHRQINVR